MTTEWVRADNLWTTLEVQNCLIARRQCIFHFSDFYHRFTPTIMASSQCPQDSMCLNMPLVWQKRKSAELCLLPVTTFPADPHTMSRTAKGSYRFLLSSPLCQPQHYPMHNWREMDSHYLDLQQSTTPLFLDCPLLWSYSRIYYQYLCYFP